MSYDLMRLDATGQSELVQRGLVSALELVEASIQQIERMQPQLNALVSIDYFERARQQAAEPLNEGAFAGVPFLIKDLLPYPGLPCSFGSRFANGALVTEGSDYTSALKEAGLIVLGKSTTSEFGLMGTTETLAQGPTRNPWDITRSAAGSSGGSAAAVAAGMVPFAHASDGGGSIRIPSSVCGLFGFKPSRGRNRSTGVDQRSLIGASVIDHCVSRSVRDSARLLAATQRRDKDAPFSPLSPHRSFQSRKLRIGIFTATAFGMAPELEVLRALLNAGILCEKLGHELIESSGPKIDAPAVGRAFFLLFGMALAPMFSALQEKVGTKNLDQFLEPFTIEIIERALAAEKPSAIEQAKVDLATAAAQMELFVNEFDVVLSPTTQMLPFPLNELSPLAAAADTLAFMDRLAGYTPGYSIAGQPAMSVPLAWTAGEHPIGCQFAAGIGQDELLLNLAYDLEEASPWAHRWPKIAELVAGAM